MTRQNTLLLLLLIGRSRPDLMGDASDTTAVETRMRRYA